MDNKDYYMKLKQLHAQKTELQRLKALVKLYKPFVIEFSGTPRTGKTTIINNLYDFFKKGGFEVSLIEEFTTSKHYKENLKSEFNKMGVGNANIAIMEKVYEQLQVALSSEKEIILIDRSINDRQVWNYRRFIRGDMSEEQYFMSRDKYAQISKQLINFLVITYAEPLISLRRDYISSLALERRNFLNQDNIAEYNDCLNSLRDLFSKSVDSYLLLDTSNLSINDTTIAVAQKILPTMRKEYINAFGKKYNLHSRN